MNLTVGTILGSAFDIADIGGTFVDARKEGVGFAGSTAKALGTQAMWMLAPSYAWTKAGMDISRALLDAGKTYGAGAGKVYAGKQERQYSHALGGGNYADTQINATMRQRGMQAIKQSGQNLNSVFGSEARTYFRGTY